MSGFYHQDERDRAYGCGALIILATVGLMAVCFVGAVAVSILSLF